MNKQYISKNFSYREMTRSSEAARRGWENTPNEQELGNIVFTANQLEKIRAYVSEKEQKDTPIIVTSCFRNEAVNRAVGGVKNSAHRFGLAADFDILGYTSYKTCLLIKEMYEKGLIDFDQLILEYPHNGDGAWVHLGFKKNHVGNRRQILTAVKRNGETEYLKGLVV